MTFELYPLRFCFLAQDSIHFPAGKSANILRGAFGTIFQEMAHNTQVRQAYARIFEPASLGSGPSGLADWPRPFVFRASHLDGATFESGQSFDFDLNVFDVREPAVPYFILAFSQLAREGIGPLRGRADLTSVLQLDACGRAQPFTDVAPPLSISLTPRGEPVHRIRVEFVTPTELKGAGTPEFPVLFARVRDRISTLRALYGRGPLDIDFKAIGERAESIRMTGCELRHVDVRRMSSRTGQTHSLGGFVGVADYEGNLTKFVPFLEAAHWTGVGRQTVWGKGEMRIVDKS